MSAVRGELSLNVSQCMAQTNDVIKSKLVELLKSKVAHYVSVCMTCVYIFVDISNITLYWLVTMYAHTVYACMMCVRYFSYSVKMYCRICWT